VGISIPERKMSNAELSRFIETSDEWIYSHTGIKNRHIADPNVSASDLALPACRQALLKAKVSPEEVDMILLATSTPDYPGLPSTACIVQDKLGCIKAGAMDIVAACSGFIYGLEIARAFINSNTAGNILVIGSEIYSKILNWEDRNTCVLFGDGAGAVVVSENNDTERASALIDSVLKSQGKDAESLLRPVGGSRNPQQKGSTVDSDIFLKMDGRKVYNFAVNAVDETINSLMERNGLAIDDIDWIVPHQANTRIIEAAAKRQNIPQEKFFLNIEEYANTSAASIPIAFNDMLRKNLLKKGNSIITVGFGAGLTYGGNLIKW
jgi:3-oxoacyl-[acyl-carrier-protein] synthase III